MKTKEVQDTYKDPVCGMVVSRLTAPVTYEYEGKTYYFCADICRDNFKANPDKYIGKWPRQEH
jgi:YHS domain-containing protein